MTNLGEKLTDEEDEMIREAMDKAAMENSYWRWLTNENLFSTPFSPLEESNWILRGKKKVHVDILFLYSKTEC